MSTKTYTVEQIIAKLREAEVALSRGQTVQEICRELGIHDTGIVNLTLVWQTGPHEKPSAQLPTSSLSLPNHQSRRLALPSILPQLP